MPAVSVIVPTYNVTAYIQQALDSLREQTFQDFEVIIVNDGCPDTPALERALEPYASRIRYIKQTNTGAAGARNTAVRAATAPLVLQLDPDDWLEPDCLEIQVNSMRQSGNWDAIYCNTTFVSDDEWNHKTWMDRYPSSGEVSFLSVIESRTCPTNPGSIIRRDTLLRLGLYDASLRSWEDYDLWLRILKSSPAGRISYNPKPLVHYRMHRSSLTKQARYMEYALQVLDKAAKEFDLSAAELAALEKRREGVRFDVEVGRAKQALEERRWRDAKDHLAWCVAHRPTMKLRAVLAALNVLPAGVLNLAVKLRQPAHQRSQVRG